MPQSDKGQSDKGQSNVRDDSSKTKDPEGSLVWRVDPTEMALAEAKAHREHRRDDGELAPKRADEFEACTEVGRRLLLSQFTFSSWVLRRVEKVGFASDRRIGRSSTIEFQIPPESPVIDTEGGEPSWLVPLSVMRRHTLVNLDLRTEQEEGISLLGLRFTQKLDEAMLKAAARLACPGVDHDDVDRFIHQVVSGKWLQVQTRLEEYEKWRDGRPASRDEHPLNGYFANATFRASLERMWHNFTLYVTLPVSAGRHRILRLAFEERVDWRYQVPNLHRDKEHGGEHEVWQYKPLAKKSRMPRIGHYFGWRATRVRFLTPGAENCASYHFEFTAPTGLWVTSAAFVAGRPNLEAPQMTPWDSVTSTGRSTGLHAVEVPNGSLCRAQVNLRVPSRGWLSTLMVSCWAIVITLAFVAWHARQYGISGYWTTTQVTNIVLLLVTICGGASTYVAQHPAGDVAARMLSGLRLGGLVVLTLPAVAAVSLVLLKDPDAGTGAGGAGKPVVANGIFNPPDFLPGWLKAALAHTHERPLLEVWLWGLTAVGCAVAVAVTFAWFLTWADEWRAGRDSPWDMTTVDEEPTRRRRRKQQRKQPISGDDMSFHELLKELQLDRKAVGVYSAEGWHERYGWDDTEQGDAVRLLGGGADGTPAHSTVCGCRAVDEHPPSP